MSQHEEVSDSMTRMWVPSGWLVIAWNSGGASCVAFVPDHDHAWVLDEPSAPSLPELDDRGREVVAEPVPPTPEEVEAAGRQAAVDALTARMRRLAKTADGGARSRGNGWRWWGGYSVCDDGGRLMLASDGKVTAHPKPNVSHGAIPLRDPRRGWLAEGPWIAEVERIVDDVHRVLDEADAADTQAAQAKDKAAQAERRAFLATLAADLRGVPHAE